MAGEREAAGLAIHPEDGDVVAALIAAVEEPAGGVEVEAARIIAPRPFFARRTSGRRSGRRRRSRCCRAAGCPRRRIARRPRPGSRSRSCCRRTRAAGWRSSAAAISRPVAAVVVEQDDRRAFLLDGVEPAAIGMEMEMPRPVAGRQRDRVRLIRRQHALLLVELPDEDPIQAQVDVQHEAPRGIGLDHVGVGPIVSADGEAARRGARRPGGAELAGILLDVAWRRPGDRRAGSAAPPRSRRSSWPPARTVPTDGCSHKSGRHRRSERC